MKNNLEDKKYKKIDVKQFIELIENLIKEASMVDAKVNLVFLQEKLAEINFYFEHPLYVTGCYAAGGLQRIRSQYEPQLLQVNLLVKKQITLSPVEAEIVAKGMQSLVQQFKVKSAYTDIYSGKKFRKAGLERPLEPQALIQPNPIQELSRKNLEKITDELKQTGGNRLHGLHDDEIELFGCLLNLPYRLQHATNYYYPILNQGSLDSYVEIKRYQSDYESPFSTKGNIEKLGNGGFVFFRLYVDPINSSQTRYGDTSLIFILELLRRCGWISLHDQLNPFSTPNAQHFFHNARLLRTSAVTGIRNTSKEKSLHDGLLYSYRTTPIKSYTGKKDTLKSFSSQIVVTQITRSFLDEIFYGEDILLGICLSVIRELRCLEACGFRGGFIELFNQSEPAQRVDLLGDLIKNLFRIEGKYPAALRLEATSTATFFSSIAQSDTLSLPDRKFQVLNPDGDGRYKVDATVNPAAMELADLRAENKKLDEKLSITRRQRARFKSDIPRWTQLTAEVEKIEDRLKAVNEVLNQDKKRRNQIIRYFCETFNVDGTLFDKVDTNKLELINEYFVEFVEDETLEISNLIAKPTTHLRLIAESFHYDLLVNGVLEFSDFDDCTLEELEILSDYDLSKAIQEHGLSLKEIVEKYNENPKHLECLACDDIQDLLLDEAPNVDPIIMQYVEKEHIEWVMEQLGESDQLLFQINLGHFDEPVDNEEYYDDEDLHHEDADDQEDQEAPQPDNLLKHAFLTMVEELNQAKSKNEAEKEKLIESLAELSFNDRYDVFFQEFQGDRKQIIRSLFDKYYINILLSATHEVTSPLQRYQQASDHYTQQYMLPSGGITLFRSFKDSEGTIGKLIAAIKTNQMTKLSLANQEVKFSDFLHLMNVLNTNQSVIELDLKNTEIIFSNPESDDLSQEFFDCVVELAETLMSCRNLRKVNLLDCSLVSHQDSIKLLAIAARANENILSIELDTDYLVSKDDDTDEIVDEINNRGRDSDDLSYTT